MLISIIDLHNNSHLQFIQQALPIEVQKLYLFRIYIWTTL